ncbi:MAG: C69 family dipeptidase [Anaerolineae bacterium]|nr:C69 family dipeptidase [Anaerolineae bacterium]
MCDTMVALPPVTRDGSLLFAKNSDRDPNEAHEVILLPAADYLPGSSLQATYLEIPQASHTYAVLLCKPFWIWGAEMGANEHGVVIGNEAVFSKVPAGKEPGLIGMDYLRLGLERGETAEDALHVIIQLLEQYGQSGNCGFDHPMYYHNSYLIADPNTAFVLETVGKEWAYQQVHDVCSISNQISITNQFDGVSEKLVTQALEKGWCDDAAAFHFHRDYSDAIYTRFADGERRSCESMQGLKNHSGDISVNTMFSILRHHRNEVPSTSSVFGADICMHAGYGPIRGSQTTGSLVANIRPEGATFWVTATSAPCSSIFKPVWFDAGLPDMGPRPKGKFDPKSLWWQHELLHRMVIQNYDECMATITEERDAFEESVIGEIATVQSMPSQSKRKFTDRVFADALALECKWIEMLITGERKSRQFVLHRKAWETWNRKAEIEFK